MNIHALREMRRRHRGAPVAANLQPGHVGRSGKTRRLSIARQLAASPVGRWPCGR